MEGLGADEALSPVELFQVLLSDLKLTPKDKRKPVKHSRQ